MVNSGEKWGKVGKVRKSSREKWENVVKSW